MISGFLTTFSFLVCLLLVLIWISPFRYILTHYGRNVIFNKFQNEVLEIDLEGRRFYPWIIFKCKKLKVLKLYNPPYSKIPSKIKNLTELEELHIYETRLVEIPNYKSFEIELPKEISHLKNLKELVLFNLKIKQLPQEFAELSSLERLELNGNRINQIPDSLFALKNLLVLDLQDNKITKINPLVCKLNKLRALRLDNNLIEVIPIEIGRLENLQIFTISHNKIKQLPKEALFSDKLAVFLIEGNLLEEKEISDMGILELKEHFNIIELVKFKIKVEEIFRTPFQQYLLFFREYIKTTKKKSIFFEVNLIDSGLEIIYKPDENISLDEIKLCLIEYMGFAKEKSIEAQLNSCYLTVKELNLLQMNLELQVQSLNKQIQLNKIRHELLEPKSLTQNLKKEKLKYLNAIENLIESNENNQSVELTKEYTSQELLFLKKECQEFIISNKVKKVFDRLFLVIGNNSEIILLNQRYNQIEKERRLNLISNEMYKIEYSNLTYSLLDFLDNYFEDK